MMHTWFYSEVFPIIRYNPICWGQFHYVQQDDTERSVDFLSLWKGELITNSVLGKLNSVNTRSQMLSHISFSPYCRTEMGKDMVMLKTAPVGPAPWTATARQSLTKPRSCWLLQPKACKRRWGKNKPGGAPLKPEGNWKPAGRHQRIKTLKQHCDLL